MTRDLSIDVLGKHITVQVDEGTTVFEVKQQLARITGKPVEIMRLMANGMCNDSDKILSLEIIKGTLLRMVFSPARNFDEVLKVNYKLPLLPTNIIELADRHNYRILCKGTQNKTHDVRNSSVK